MALRKRIGKTLAKRAKSGILFQKVLERPFFEAAIKELKCKDLDVDDFYQDFKKELKSDKTKEVEIYCPFTSELRWQKIEPWLARAFKRKVKIVVYINSIENPFIHSKREVFHQKVIDWLKKNGGEVLEFKFMHQKGVFFDDRLAYVGSLNIFSFSPLGRETTDIMLRFEVPQVVKALKLAFQGMLGGEEPDEEAA